MIDRHISNRRRHSLERRVLSSTDIKILRGVGWKEPIVHKIIFALSRAGRQLIRHKNTILLFSVVVCAAIFSRDLSNYIEDDIKTPTSTATTDLKTKKFPPSIGIFQNEVEAFLKRPRTIYINPTLSVVTGSLHPGSRTIDEDDEHDLRLYQKDGLSDLYEKLYSDPTRKYGMGSSADHPSIVRREPASNGPCVPMSDWQTDFYPTCNDVHGMELVGEHDSPSSEEAILLSLKGFWRYAWSYCHRLKDSCVILKNLKFDRDFEDIAYELHRVDAMAMERLSSSPHVVSSYGFCGQTVLTEVAEGTSPGRWKFKGIDLLTAARDVAAAVADVHGMGGEEGTNFTFVHFDVNPNNMVLVGGKMKINDFNIGAFLKWNTTSGGRCGISPRFANAQWRSPEEMKPYVDGRLVTEKIDVYSMGNIFYYLLTGVNPWTKLEVPKKPTKDEINDSKREGGIPYLPDKYSNTKDPIKSVLRSVMHRCFQFNPEDRPTARELKNELDGVINQMKTKS